MFFQEAFTEDGADPGAVVAIQSFRDFLGFNVFCGERIQPVDEKAMENLARYIVRASFSQEGPPWCDSLFLLFYSIRAARSWF